MWDGTGVIDHPNADDGIGSRPFLSSAPTQSFGDKSQPLAAAVSSKFQSAAPRVAANGQDHTPSVEALLLRAGEAHQQEVDILKEKLKTAQTEIQRLRSLARSVGGEGDVVSPQAVQIELALMPESLGRRPDVGQMNAPEQELKLHIPASGSISFEARAAWNQDIQINSVLKLDEFMSAGARNPQTSGMGGVDKMRPLDEFDFPANVPCVISPETTWRLTWDLAGLVLIFYDLLSIPFVQCFSDDPGLTYAAEHGLLSWMDWVTLVFWTGDMLQGFFLGYWKDGRPVTSHTKVLLNYLRTWFLVDVLVVGPEWMLVFAAGSGGYPTIGLLGKILKSARAIRVLRLVRLVKLQRIVNKCYDMITEEKTFIAVNLLKLLLAILFLNHVIACCWYGLGRLGRGDLGFVHPQLDNWIEAYRIGSGSLGYKYTTSLHWSLTQFTPASMPVSATNVGERVFSIIVLFFAMVCFSSIVGSITSSMTQLRSLRTDDTKQFWLLRRFLKQKCVDKNLDRCIIKFLEYQVGLKVNQVQFSQLKVLQFLSQDLSRELEHSILHVHWQEHPFFDLLDQKTNVILYLIDNNKTGKRCLNLRFCSEEEKIFDAGEEAKFMYFVCWRNIAVKHAEVDEEGNRAPIDFCFEYTPAASPGIRQKLGSGEWISEAVLWTEDWRHVGRFKCCYVCEIMTVDPDTFIKVVRGHPRPWFVAKTYAHLFLKWINDQDEEHALPRRDVTDLLRNGSDFLSGETPWYRDAGERVEDQLREVEQGIMGEAQQSPKDHRPAEGCQVVDLWGTACAEDQAGPAQQQSDERSQTGPAEAEASSSATPAPADSRRRLLGAFCCALVGGPAVGRTA